MFIRQLHTRFNVPVAVLCRRFGIPRASFYHKSTWDDSELLDAIKKKKFQAVIRKWRIREEVIPPGQPFNNGHIESYQGTMREEQLLDREEFDSLEEARQKILGWVKEYNNRRPHSALGYRTPMEVWNEYYEH